MEVIKGIATSVRYTVNVTGNKDGISTRHHAIFKVGATTVMFSSASPAVIGEGDHLVVAGRRRGRGLLLAEAFRNDTAGVRGDSGMWVNFVGMVGSFLAGSIGLGWALLEPLIPELPRLDESLWWLVSLAGAFLTILGFYCLYKWLRIRSAVGLVKGS
jgi:hypothetical protein